MQTSAEAVRRALLEELQAGLGNSSHATSFRLEAHEADLRPMFIALPKNSKGRLEHAAVRYALHRYFAQRHGWSVKGLDPAGRGWNGSNASSILQDRVPAYVQELFERQLSGHGMGLHDLAALAATLEHLVHDDAVSRLAAAYHALGLPTDGTSEAQALEAIDTFMMMFVLGQDIRDLSAAEIEAERASIHSVYPGWQDTQDFVRGVYHNTTTPGRPGADPVPQEHVAFETARKAAEALQDQYGPWQDRECRDMKRALLRMEEGSTGRVLLTDFYGRNAEVGWQFAESIDYLRDLGALDESDSARPRVVVANYVNGVSNCLASTGFYSVCCMNECEALLGEIERQVAAPTAPASQLSTIVAGLGSTTVAAPRNLSAQLLHRLEEVAAHHGGRVPLHGRLFSQWLHHAFPRECPFPHAAGTTNPMTPEEWMAETGLSTMKPADAREQPLGADKAPQGPGAEAAALPWVGVEELVHPVSPAQAPPEGHLRAVGRGLVLLAVSVAMLRSLLRDAALLRSSKLQDGLLLPYSAKRHAA